MSDAFVCPSVLRSFLRFLTTPLALILLALPVAAGDDEPGIKIPMVLLLCLIGGGSYAAFGTVVGAFRLSEVKAALRRRG